MSHVRSQRGENSRLPASSKYDTFFLLQSLSSCRDVAGTGCLWRERKTVHPSSTCEPKRSPVRPFSSRISSASRPAPSASATNTPHEITITPHIKAISICTSFHFGTTSPQYQYCHPEWI